MVSYWHVPPLWRAETAFLLGGGPSLTQPVIDSLRGRRVVAINMSYLNAPWADILFFADHRWWEREMKERRQEILTFPGRIVTTCEVLKDPPRPVSFLRRVVPHDVSTGLALSDDTVAMERTSLQGAMNLCYHLGTKRIVLLGADNRDAPNGRIHHHDEYPWVRHKPSWDIKGRQMGYGAARLKEKGVEVINCSPVSTLPHWPIRPIEDVLNEVDHESRLP